MGRDGLRVDPPSARCAMTRQAAVVLTLSFLAGASSASGQSFHVVNLDPTLYVADINNRLEGVGSRRGDGGPFIIDDSGIRLFPELPHDPTQINNAGVIAGTRGLNAFRVDRSGSAYSEATFPGLPFVHRLTDSGLALVSATSFVQTPFGTRTSVEYYLWDGVNVVRISDYYLPIAETVHDVGEDGTIVGSLFFKPFVQRPGEAPVRPWESGSAVAIGSGGHVLGSDDTGTPILRGPDGAIRRFPELTRSVLYRVNRSGDFVGSYWNAANSRSEAFLVRGGQVVNLNDHFNSPGEYLGTATNITDAGTVLSSAMRADFSGQRDVLLLPSLQAPVGLTTSVIGQQVVVAWQPSLGASDYTVEVGSQSGLNDLYNGTVDDPGIAGIVPPGRYFVRVRARGPGIVSSPSAEIVVNVF